MSWYLQAQAEEVPAYSLLLKQSLMQAPILLEQAANVRAADAEVQQARVFINPSIGGMTENLNAGTANPRQDTITVTQPFEIGGKRAARIEARTRIHEVEEARDSQVKIAYAAELATSYAAAENMSARVTIAKDDLARANDDLRVATALVNAGKEAQLRVSQAKAAVSAAEAALQTANANLVASLERLSAMTGNPTSYTDIRSSFTYQAITKGLPDTDSLLNSPSILRAQAEQEAYKAQVVVEEKRWIPDVGISAGIRRFEGANDNAFVFGISTAIPIFDRNRGGIAAAQERVSAAEARLTATKLEVNANRRSAISQVHASQRKLEAAMQGESSAEEAYRLGKIGYESGKTSLIELLLTRKSLTDAKLTTSDARFTLVQALASLAAIEGRIAFGDIKE